MINVNTYMSPWYRVADNDSDHLPINILFCIIRKKSDVAVSAKMSHSNVSTSQVT